MYGYRREAWVCCDGLALLCSIESGVVIGVGEENAFDALGGVSEGAFSSGSMAYCAIQKVRRGWRSCKLPAPVIRAMPFRWRDMIVGP